MNIFAQLTQGDSADWPDGTFSDTTGKSFTSGSHTLTYYLTQALLKNPLVLIATAKGSGWTTSITSTQSATLSPGRCEWSATLTAAGGVRVTVGRGLSTILPDLTAEGGNLYDGSSGAEKIVSAIDAYMLGQATAQQIDVVEYQIEQRHLKKDRASLLTIRGYYLSIAQRERIAQNIANGLGNPRRVMVRFLERH